MKKWLLDIIVCPSCKESLAAKGPWVNDEIIEGELFCERCQMKWPVVGGIPRFVDVGDGYCENFGQQWNRFKKTQIDSFSGNTHSKDRFCAETGWSKDFLKDALVLDAGCGSGRFADVAIDMGARVICIDMSSAVDACKGNLSENHDSDRFEVVQASIYELPFAECIFKGVYSLGVIQHTPDRKGAVQSLIKYVAKDGELALWVYEKSWRSLLGYKYWFRLITKYLPLIVNWKLSNILVNIFFPIAWYFNKLPKFGHYLTRLLPMAFRYTGSMTKIQSKEWSLLDTFDNLSPRYDFPITERSLQDWINGSGLIFSGRRPTPGLAVTARRG